MKGSLIAWACPVAIRPDDVVRQIVWEGAAAPPPTRQPVGTVSVNPFELLRAISGRRSAVQIRAFGWSVDPEPFLPAFGHGPFTPRSTDLIE